jgi:hypothetical protein
MTENKSIYCGLAFGSVSINSSGQYLPCCNIRSSEFNTPTNLDLEPIESINADNLKDVREKLINGEWPKACYNCKESEEVDVRSMRNIWNDYITDAPMVKHVNPLDIKFLDLTFATTCNSKCMTCCPKASNFWEEEWQALHPHVDERFIKFNRITIDETNASKLIKYFPNVIKISFVGGEPTISDEHFSFLQKLVDEARSKNIELSYVTNLTGLNDRLIDLWKNFKSIVFSVSIDGYGKVNEYIRYPFKWSKTETNLRTLLAICKQDYKKFGVGLSCTHSIFNAIQAPDLLEFWYDLLKEYGLLENCGAFLNKVNDPPSMMVCHLSKSYRQIGIQKVQNLLSKIEKDNEPVLQANIDCIKHMASLLSEPWSGDINKIKEVQKFIKGSDEFRKRDMKDYIPELVDELNTLVANDTSNTTP